MVDPGAGGHQLRIGMLDNLARRSDRMLGVGAQIGFHAISTIQDGHRAETQALDIDLERWLTELGYPLDATATIVNTHAASIRWYDAIELRANGIPTEVYP